MMQTNRNETKVKKIWVMLVPGFDNEVEAKAEASEFKTATDIVMNRSAFFPNPANYHVNCEITEAKEIKYMEMSGLPPSWAVVLTLKICGNRGTLEEQRRNINDWIDNAYAKMKGIPGAL